MKILLPLHYDGNNRGCEAITKATSILWGIPQKKMFAYSNNVELDSFLRINDYVTLVRASVPSKLFLFYKKIRGLFVSTELGKKNILYKYKYKCFLDTIENGDIVLSTGGDMFCYDDNEVIYTNEYSKRRGAKTILWGCSIGEKNLTAAKIKVLKSFDFVYARENLTKEVLHKIGLTNIRVFPDPAFILKPEVVDLPKIFNESKVIGLNLSNYVLGGYDLSTPFGKAIKLFLDYIVSETDYKVLLIPHVMWETQNDMVVCGNVYNIYKNSQSVFLLDSDSYNYCQIRNIISNCEIFIGGRTHSVISAYSTCVPAIALGYSIKSMGIANDVGMPLETVVDTTKVTNDSVLINAFLYLLKNIKSIKKQLSDNIPVYIERLNDLKSSIESEKY